MPDSVEVALKEFESLRTETEAHQRTKNQYMTLAVTATGAIGSFALGRNGNRDVLLVLPLVLSGLTILYLRHNVDIELIGQYIRNRLWSFISDEVEARRTAELPQEIPSWDDWIQNRRIEMRRESVYGAMGILPSLLIFGAPSLGALVISFAEAQHHGALLFVWGLDIVVVVASLGFTLWSYTEAPGWKHDPESSSKIGTIDRREPRGL